MTNKIYYGDNLDVLRRYIKDETVDLCYIDPPFNSKRNYNQIYGSVVFIAAVIKIVCFIKKLIG